MIETMTEPDRYAADFERLTAADSSAPAWIASLRRSAMDAFERLGFPTARDEAWRQTNIAPIAGTAFARAAAATALVTESDLTPYTLGPDACHRVVLVNGRLDEDLTRLRTLEPGVRVERLAESLRAGAGDLEGVLAAHARVDRDAFTALNTAFIDDGVVIRVPDGASVEAPIEVLHLTLPEDEPIVTHPRTLIVLGSGARATVVERYVGLRDGVYLTNAVTEIVAGEASNIDHYKLGRESAQAFHVGTLHITQAGPSRAAAKVVTLGGAIVRNNMNTVLGAAGCDCNLRGLTITGDEQLVDNHLRVEHAEPNCDSREFFKNILTGRSRVVFTGRIYVAPDAQKTDAKQTNMSLLLSDDAQVNAQPQLEIFADDVKCTHGATVGELDEEAMFYLESRGIDPTTARSLLIYAFAAESLDEIRLPPLRRQMEQLLFERLPGGRMLSRTV